MGRRKTWKEKFERPTEPKVVDDPKGRGKMLVPTPVLVDSVIRRIPRGKLITVNMIRDVLARRFNADFSCPLATGWFIKIAAWKAEEDMEVRGMDIEQVTPYWRVVKADGSLNNKFPGGQKQQAEMLRGEGHVIMEKRGRLYVKDFRNSLVDWEAVGTD